MTHLEYLAAREAKARADFIADIPRFDSMADLKAVIDDLPVLTLQDFSACVRKLLKDKPEGTALMDGTAGVFFIVGDGVLFGDDTDEAVAGDLDDGNWEAGTWEGQSRLTTMARLCTPTFLLPETVES